MLKALRYFIPLFIFLALSWFLWKGLSIDPQKLPSALIGKKVPPFDLPLLEDSRLHLTEKALQGRVSLLNVWASWCEACRLEHPYLMDIARLQQVAVYGIDYKDDVAAARHWLQQYGSPYQAVGFDVDGKVGINLGVYGTPETFLIDRHGVIRYKVVGPLMPDVWRKIYPLIVQLQSEQ